MGVKSLWTLLTPVGRPILLETVEGKTMAIDSSIWIYQFQATMRDKEGRGLVNAHVLGFLRRITKLLFYGIKPVFVFDGGAPVIKRATLSERKKKKSGAVLSHARIAERLLAAQLRKEALSHAQKSSKGKGKAKEIDDDVNVVYLEDIDDSIPKAPKRPPPSTEKKNKYQDHDPYRLPEVNLDEAVAKATRTTIPDPRLATEDELRDFIEQMRPEDFDITSPEFRELPTEVQYEIIGDLRLKSRQTSHARLQRMLRLAPTPMDFSKQQIVNLKQRNSLTQQLLVTTDSIGNAHITIPVRIASERNREYVLTKNEGVDGGWVLAIQDKTGVAPEKPILIDGQGNENENEDEDEDADMEEVDTGDVVDPDLRRYQREMALSAIAARYSPKKLAPLTTKPIKSTTSKPLFDLDVDDEDAEAIGQAIQQMKDAEDAEVDRQAMEQFEDDEDEALALAIQQSLDQTKLGSHSTTPKASPSKLPQESPRSLGFPNARRPSPEVDIFTPSGLETALAFAGTGSPKKKLGYSVSGTKVGVKASFGMPSLLSSSRTLSTRITTSKNGEDIRSRPIGESSSSSSGLSAVAADSEDDDMEEVDIPIPTASEDKEAKMPSNESPSQPPAEYEESGDEDMEEVEAVVPDLALLAEEPLVQPSSPNLLRASPEVTPPLEYHEAPPSVSSILPPPQGHDFTVAREDPSSGTFSTGDIVSHEPEHEAELGNSRIEPVDEQEPWDAAHEIDPNAEEGEYARFLSQVKGRNLNDVQKEIDDEIKILNDQRKAAMRDSEDITQQMISQIMTMLRLFGIPYITAPMEAEAQCAELVSLGLVDGVITDDSDVFLFGAQRVYKNMFNQSKTVELFLLSDLERELGLDRDTLVRLAYLLGSDYTDGLSGVGPVVAMELLKEFPNKEGLHRFADWWRRVQEGKDKEEESNTKTRRQFKKKFKDLYLPSDWPNPAVRDAYYHPAVDSSEEPFKWGLPDLDALRAFFNQELGWGQTKVDELLLPIIQKMNRRRNNASSTTAGIQNSLLDWVNVHAGNNPSGNMAPRKKEVYSSRRLQQVVTEFRKRKQSGSVGSSQSERLNSDEEEDSAPVKKQRKTTRARGGKAGRGRGGKPIASRGKRKKAKDDDDDDAYTEEDSSGVNDNEPQEVIPESEGKPRPRPRRKYFGA
ncbi:hypothetical protein AGABI2DRAFT_217997 [Agaricus bisporus var. bisporus H97]|uniref:hypothetical protein n=1 Tax=Agaricus bisporus var. bisporus (strain H97 / ATCC MYA-4626 / FGSC 10389) TaxID=936046 RepID=UPI00029F738F|nr:hypothetical protein AGABI2DRAFT_217997 [Agaricus bisporus var. bisporus H97]EKV49008.1 hypothetical protein AGABI2DRAFT_217997 [Agaricus bisporus var. bisporus H97]